MATATRAALAATLVAACVGLVGPAREAEAALAPTLLSNLLTVSVVPPTANLTTAAGVASGSLGTVTVVDGRLAASSYDVSVSTAGFDLVGALTSTSASHIPASAVSVANTAVTGGTASRTSPVALPSGTPIFRVTYSSAVALVNLVSTYTMSMSLVIPAPAASGQYTGTVTQTVA
jgi:hypothetical protein